MAILTWKKVFNGYLIELKFKCHYKNGSIVEFDSHDMSENINKVFDKINNEVLNMDFLKLSKYLFDKISNLYSVEFISDNSKSMYFIDDVSNN